MEFARERKRKKNTRNLRSCGPKLVQSKKKTNTPRCREERVRKVRVFGEKTKHYEGWQQELSLEGHRKQQR